MDIKKTRISFSATIVFETIKYGDFTQHPITQAIVCKVIEDGDVDIMVVTDPSRSEFKPVILISQREEE